MGWLRRLIYLDTTVFDDVRSDPTATISGVLIAAAAFLISGIGGWLWWRLNDFGASGDVFLNSAIAGSLLALALWGLWIFLTFVTLTQVFRERAFLEQLLRVMGLATAPMALMGFMFIPGISFGIGVAALALTFGLTTIAIKSATTADQAQVLVANLVGFLVWASVLTLASSANATTTKPHAPGIFLYNTVTSVFDDLVNPTGE
ncbi:MAG TPA: hypothetical protein VI759_01220 [Dehalococcoidia bacterium]|nr:hypothetical protein [Dehalococcoidia bacterium]